MGAPENIVRAIAGTPQGGFRDTLLAALGYSPELAPVSEIERIRANKQIRTLLDDGQSTQGEISLV